MNNLTKLLGLATVGASITKTRLIQRFVRDLAGILTLAIVTGVMAGALLVGAFYIAYQGLTSYGLEPMAAQIVLAALGITTVAVLLSITSFRLRHIKNLPGQIIQTEFPFASRLNGIADGFLDGFLSDVGR